MPGRPKKQIPPVLEAQLVTMTRSGATAGAIARATGIPLATVKRRMRDVGPGPVAPRAPAAPSGGEAEGDIPEGASLQEIDEWLADAERAAREAKDAGQIEHHQKWVRLAISLLEAKRRATPQAKVDPNEMPDMVAAATAAREKLHKLVDSLERVSKSTLGERIAEMLRG